MCDFGISGYLVDSVAKTIDAGCKPYMAVRNRVFLTTEILSVSYQYILHHCLFL